MAQDIVQAAKCQAIVEEHVQINEMTFFSVQCRISQIFYSWLAVDSLFSMSCVTKAFSSLKQEVPKGQNQ